MGMAQSTSAALGPQTGTRRVLECSIKCYFLRVGVPAYQMSWGLCWHRQENPVDPSGVCLQCLCAKVVKDHRVRCTLYCASPLGPLAASTAQRWSLDFMPHTAQRICADSKEEKGESVGYVGVVITTVLSPQISSHIAACLPQTKPSEVREERGSHLRRVGRITAGDEVGLHNEILAKVHPVHVTGGFQSMSIY